MPGRILRPRPPHHPRQPGFTGHRLLVLALVVASIVAATFIGTTVDGSASSAPSVAPALTAANGYRLVAADGGIFAFGGAGFDGSMGAKHLNSPIVGMASTPTGNGYWLVAADGGIFAFGDASFQGSMGAEHLNSPIVGMGSSEGVTGPRLAPANGFSSAAEVVYGSAGSFGALAYASTLPGGQSVATEAVPGWGFLPGQGVMGAVLGPDGSIVMGGEPLTGNQSMATANTMSLSVFNPSSFTFQNVLIPTTTGSTSVTQPGYPTGGADIASLVSVPGKGNQVAFLSAWPYRGWNADTLGQYPTFGYVAPSGSGYQYVAGSGRTSYDIGSSAPNASACQSVGSSYNPPLADCRGPVSMGVLPASGDIAVAQYFNNISAGMDSGGLMVLTPDGQQAASYDYPNVTMNGSPVYVYPREVDVDPTSTPNHERFAVIFDTFVPGPNGSQVRSPFAMQIFDFDAATGTITPESAPILPGQTVGGSTAYFETAHFDQHGNLWASESVNNSITGGNIVEYSAASVAGKLTSGSCSAQPSWASTQWDQTCTPDLTLTAAAGQGDVYSVTEDTATGAIYFASGSGYLISVVPRGGSWTVGTIFDYGINSLVDRNQVNIGDRQGVIDPTTGYLWLPIEQHESNTSCNLPAGQASCMSTPTALNQWLIRIDLNQLGS